MPVVTPLVSLVLSCCLLSAAPPQRLRHRQLSQTPVAEPTLALAFLGDRFLALSPDSVSLWRLEGSGFRRETREPLSHAAPPVRHGGGLIVGRLEEKAAWLASSYWAGARLARIEGARLVLDATADAAPWPAAPEGLRFRPGTNLVDGLRGVDGPQSIVALDSSSGAVVGEDGMLLVDSLPTGLRVGSALASLWPDTFLASAPNPPGAEDALLVVRRDGGRWEEALRISVPGVVSALAARRDGASAHVVVGLASASGPSLLRLELRPEP